MDNGGASSMLKKRVNQKLKSEKGTSIFFGLLLFLVASMVSIVILNGAVTTVKRVESDRKAEQNYLTCSSAAKLLRDEIVNSQVAKVKTVTEQKKSNNSVASTKTSITWKGTSVSAGTADGTTNEFATYFQKYLEDYSKSKDNGAVGTYTKKFTISVPSNLQDQKEKEAFGEVTAELTIEEAAKVNETSPSGFDIFVKLMTGTGSDTCQMFLQVSGKASPEKIETTETSTGTENGTGKTVTTTTTTTYSWEPLKIIYGDKEIGTEE